MSGTYQPYPIPGPALPPVLPPGVPGIPGIPPCPPGFIPPGFLPPPGIPAPFMSSPSQPAFNVNSSESPWVEHLAPDGRRYYYNRITKQSTWEKPNDLKTPGERIMANCPWKEFKAENGRVYFYNSQTKQSVWTKPPELVEAEKQAEAANAEANKPAPPGVVTIAAPTVAAALPTATVLTPAPPADQATPRDDGVSKATVSAPAPVASSVVSAPATSGSSAIEEAMKATLASIDASIPDSRVNGGPPADGLSTGGNQSVPGPPMTQAAETRRRSSSSSSSSESSNEDEDEESSRAPEVVQPSANTNSATHRPLYKSKAELAEGWRQLFRDMNVPGNATWETAVKLIINDPRYPLLKNFNEKKQIFNVYKTQRQKEEREEQRLKAKKAREDLEKFLLRHSKLHSTMTYRKIDSLLGDCPEWIAVSDRDRRDICEDVVQQLAKREHEEAERLKARNKNVFKEILRTMLSLTYRTTWTEAQQMLLDNARFTEDKDLQSMDKEDALICFEEHIYALEAEHETDKDSDRRLQKRIQRKNREAFLVFLDELHENGKLTAQSLWKDLYTIVSRDERFHKMLAQRGSTPLDLFKFYVESLKLRFPAEKKIVKEILKDRAFDVEVDTPLDEFVKLINLDERGRTLDAGNVRQAFTSLKEKAEGREKERQREEGRKLRRLEQGFKEMLKLATDPAVVASTSWEQVRDRFGQQPAFQAIPLESERMRVFKEYLVSLDELNSHRRLADKKKAKKEKREKKRARSGSSSPDGVGETKKRKKQDSTPAASVPAPEKAPAPPSVLPTPAPAPAAAAAPPAEQSAPTPAVGQEAVTSEVKEKRRHKKSKKKKKKKQKRQTQDSSDGEVSEGAEGTAATVKRRRTGGGSPDSTADMSEGELMERKKKLLEQLHG